MKEFRGRLSGEVGLRERGGRGGDSDRLYLKRVVARDLGGLGGGDRRRAAGCSLGVGTSVSPLRRPPRASLSGRLLTFGTETIIGMGDTMASPLLVC